jgi:CRP-like cAMP-binding protein
MYLHAPRVTESDDTDPPPAPSAAAREQNRLLRTLPAGSYEQLLLRLEPVRLRLGHVLWEPREPISRVVFPRNCVVSLVVPLPNTRAVEAATVGREGMAGVPIALGATSTTMRAIVQVEGDALWMDAESLVEVMADDPALTRTLLRYAQALQEQTAQLVACNARHDVDARCARWLLMTQDRVGADRFDLTQDFLAQMLGVRRATVTVAASALQHDGIIRYARGHVTIVDRARLEAAACACYEVVREREVLLPA